MAPFSPSRLLTSHDRTMEARGEVAPPRQRRRGPARRPLAAPERRGPPPPTATGSPGRLLSGNLLCLRATWSWSPSSCGSSRGTAPSSRSGSARRRPSSSWPTVTSRTPRFVGVGGAALANRPPGAPNTLLGVSDRVITRADYGPVWRLPRRNLVARQAVRAGARLGPPRSHGEAAGIG